MHLINTSDVDNPASSPRKLLDHIRDLQGYCSIQGSNFSTDDEMNNVFGDICKNLKQIGMALGELHRKADDNEK